MRPSQRRSSKSLSSVFVSMCIPLSSLRKSTVDTFPWQRRTVKGVIFYPDRAVSKENKSLVSPRTNSLSIHFLMLHSIYGARGSVRLRYYAIKCSEFESRWGNFFSIYLILPAALDPGVHSASIKNEYQKQKNNVSGE
jgi:hypothetical protein